MPSEAVPRFRANGDLTDAYQPAEIMLDDLVCDQNGRSSTAIWEISDSTERAASRKFAGVN